MTSKDNIGYRERKTSFERAAVLRDYLFALESLIAEEFGKAGYQDANLQSLIIINQHQQRQIKQVLFYLVGNKMNIGLIPGGQRRTRNYLVERYNPQKIQVFDSSANIEPPQEIDLIPGEDYPYLENISTFLTLIPANHIRIRETFTPKGVIRPLYKIKLEGSGVNIWGQAIGQGTILFPRI